MVHIVYVSSPTVMFGPDVIHMLKGSMTLTTQLITLTLLQHLYLTKYVLMNISDIMVIQIHISDLLALTICSWLLVELKCLEWQRVLTQTD